MDMMQPCNVAVLVFGYTTEQGKMFMKMVEHGDIDCHPPVDIRDYLKKDPSNNVTVSHHENADSIRTQQALLNSGTNFVNAVSKVVYDVNALSLDDHGGTYRRPSIAKIYPVYCKAGKHGADGTAKFAQHAVNAVVVGGNRVFNCNVFSLSTARTARDVRDTVQDAQKWLAEAWSLCEPDANFGKQASAISPRAKAAWDAIVGFPCDLAGLHDMAQNAAQLRGGDRDVDLSPSSPDVDLSPSSPSEPRRKKRGRRSEHRNTKRSRRARSSARHNKKRRRTNIDVRRSSPQRAEPDRATLAPQASQRHPDQVDQRPKI